MDTIIVKEMWFPLFQDFFQNIKLKPLKNIEKILFSIRLT